MEGDIPIPAQKRRCEITIISFSRSICRGGLAALIGVTGKPYPSCLSCHSHPIRPCGAPSPRGEGCDTRIPSSKKATHHPCEPIRSPVSSSRAQPRDLYCTAAIGTHTLSFKRHLGASFFAFLSPTIYRSARSIPLLRPHDTQEKRIVSHPLSYRCVELCLSEALYPAPLARPFSKGLLVSSDL